jgi:hypothetical protein
MMIPLIVLITAGTAADEEMEFFTHDTLISQIQPMNDEYVAVNRAGGSVAVLYPAFKIKTILIPEGAGEAVFDPENSRFYICFENTIRIFQRNSAGRWGEETAMTLEDRAVSIDRRPTDGSLAVATASGRTLFFDSRGRPRNHLRIGLCKGPIQIVRFFDTRWLLTVADGLPTVWELSTHQIACVLYSDSEEIKRVTKAAARDNAMYVAYADGTFSKYFIKNGLITVKSDKTIILPDDDFVTDLYIATEYLYLGTNEGKIYSVHKANFTVEEEPTVMEGDRPSVTAITLLEDEITVIPVTAGGRKPVPRPALAGTVKIRATYLEESYYRAVNLTLTAAGEPNAEPYTYKKRVQFSETNQQSPPFFLRHGRYTIGIAEADITAGTPELVVEKGAAVVLDLFIPSRIKPGPQPEPKPSISLNLSLNSAVKPLDPLFTEAAGNRVAGVYRDAAGFVLAIAGGASAPVFADLPGEVSACESTAQYIALGIGSVVYTYNWEGEPLEYYETGGPIRTLALNGNRIAAAGTGLKICNGKTATIDADFHGEALSMCFNPAGSKLYVSGGNRFIYRVDTATGKIDERFNYIPGSSAVTSMDPLSEMMLFVVSADGQTALVDCVTRPGNVLRRPAEKTPVKAVFRYGETIYTWDIDNNIQSRTVMGEARPDSNRTADSTTVPRFLASGKLVTSQGGELLITSVYGSRNRIYISQDRSWLFLQGTGRYAASSPDLVFNGDRPLTEEEREAGQIAGNISL